MSAERTAPTRRNCWKPAACAAKRSILVETPEDVPQNLAKADDRVALTAGASTPQWLLEQVRARIEENAK